MATEERNNEVFDTVVDMQNGIDVVDTIDWNEDLVPATTEKPTLGEAGLIGLAAIGIGCTGYGLYKAGRWAAGKIKSAIDKKKAEKVAEEDIVPDDDNNDTK